MKIMVSACLLGKNCKYNGGNNYCLELDLFSRNHNVMLVCPETAGGLSVPRHPCEIVCGKVSDKDGQSFDQNFRWGAEKCLAHAKEWKPDLVILQSRSPSCGCKQVYDGTFSSTLIPGMGIFAKLLADNGFRIIDVEDFLHQKQDYEREGI